MVKLAVLDFGAWHDAFDDAQPRFGEMLARWVKASMPDARVDLISIVYGAAFPDVTAYDGYVISGSEKGVYDTSPWMSSLRDFLMAAKTLDKPLFGVCFGHQIMADVFGGKAEKVGLPHVGVRRFECDGAEFSAHVWHQDQVTEAPEGATITVTSSYCPIAGLDYPFKARSVQFHPEYSAPFVLYFLNLHMPELLAPDLTEKAITEFEASTVPADLWSNELSDFFHGALGR